MKYSWHSFSRVARILGYKQIPTQNRGYVYFCHPIYDKLTLEKKNNYDEDNITKYLGMMKLPLPYFERIYNKCKDE